MPSVVIGLIVSIVGAGIAHAQPRGGPSYQVPHGRMAQVLDAQPAPLGSVSPDRQTLLLLQRRPMASIETLAAPVLGLAGLRINPLVRAPHPSPSFSGLTFASISGGTERSFAASPDASVMPIGFAPNGKLYAFGYVRPNGVELWVAEVATGRAKPVTTSRLSAVLGPPCEWLRSATELLCAFVPERMGPEPSAPLVPVGPRIEEHSGGPAPARTYQNLLRSEHDDRMFVYLAARQLAYVELATGKLRLVGRHGLIDQFSASPDGRYVLVSELKRPFSHRVPADRFPKDVEIWDRTGQVQRTVGALPLAESLPIGGVRPGPRSYSWKPTDAATIAWLEALDSGDPRRTASYRDRLVSLAAPFRSEPTEMTKTEHRIQGVNWTDGGLALVAEVDQVKRLSRTWILEPSAPAPRKFRERTLDDRYSDPGIPLKRSDTRSILQHGDWIYQTGLGASPKGDRPFLDRVNLRTGATDRLFVSEGKSFEFVIDLLAEDGSRFLTRYESSSAPPNYAVRESGRSELRPLTTWRDPSPAMTHALQRRMLVTYARRDGVQLSGTIYLPNNFKEGEPPPPMLLWAYPKEFGSASSAGQVVGSSNRFVTVSDNWYFALLSAGFAIFDGPAMPIVGEGDKANDRFVEQLVWNAEAAIDKAVSLGVADRDRVAIGGHSYGAFMVANLLAHSDLFKLGIALSGAYNRSLTPFGFQNERRTFWQAPDLYGSMSPLFHAHRIKAPLLLIHGDADDNDGTLPIQSRLLYEALSGLGGRVRYVALPLESHRYVARESVLHTVLEMFSWMLRWMPDARPMDPDDDVKDR